MKNRLSISMFGGLQLFLKGLMINIMMILFLVAFGGGPVQAATGIPPTGSMITLTAVNGHYVSAANNGNILIAHQQTAGDDETFEVVDAGSGRVGLKCLGNGQYVCAESSGNDACLGDIYHQTIRR